MRIKKMYQGTAPENKILNIKSDSQTDTYSCDFLLDYCHPVGEVFTTTDSTFNPNTAWGGTWQQITDDAYFKIVSSNAGNLGGTSSQHKIPITSMPSHNHAKKLSVYNQYSSGWYHIGYLGVGNGATEQTSLNGNSDQNTGGGQAYYPYYYGVYAWHRTA